MKVLVTPRSFAQYSQLPVEILEEKGFEIIKDPKGSILTEDELITLIKDVDAIIVGVDPLSERVLKHAQNLKVISKYGVGVDNIDVDYAKSHNIPVEIALNANANAVADYAFTLMASVARRVIEIHNACLENDWSKKSALDIYQKTIGIIGYGEIGKGVAKRATGFDMNVLVYDPFAKEEVIGEKVDLDTLLTQSDFVSIHTPLTNDTHHLINASNLGKMKETAILVNTARGGVVDEDALYHALKDRKIYGAGLDVFEVEPPTGSNLLTLPNVVLGAHSAASTVGAVDQMGLLSSKNVVKYYK